MVIYPLPPEELDDKALGKMISAIAQTLCSVHWHIVINAPQHASDEELIAWGRQRETLAGFFTQLKIANASIPYSPDEWTSWARSCRANYTRLLEYGMACCREYIYRNSGIENFSGLKPIIANVPYKKHKHHDVIAWLGDNVPDLNDWGTFAENGERISLQEPALFPLVMPDKFKRLTSYNPDNWHPPEHIDNIIYAYRNYYAHLLQKAARKKCKNCAGIPCVADHYCKDCGCDGYITQAPVWSRREKPSFLGDL